MDEGRKWGTEEENRALTYLALQHFQNVCRMWAAMSAEVAVLLAASGDGSD